MHVQGRSEDSDADGGLSSERDIVQLNGLCPLDVLAEDGGESEFCGDVMFFCEEGIELCGEDIELCRWGNCGE